MMEKVAKVGTDHICPQPTEGSFWTWKLWFQCSFNWTRDESFKNLKEFTEKPIIGDLEHSQKVHFLLVLAREQNKLMILRYHIVIAFASK